MTPTTRYPRIERATSPEVSAMMKPATQYRTIDTRLPGGHDQAERLHARGWVMVTLRECGWVIVFKKN